MKKAVIFDMDGVIIDSELVYQKRREQFFREKDIILTADRQQSFIGTNPDDLFLALFPEDEQKQKRERLKAEFLTFRENYVMDIPGMLNPEIEEVLICLKEAGYRLAVASSGAYASVMNVLEQTKLTTYFELIVSGQQFAKSKPDPEIYRYTATHLGLLESECLAIEDSEHGVKAAQAAGIDVLGLVNKAYQVDLSQATHVIHSLTELPDWLKR